MRISSETPIYIDPLPGTLLINALTETLAFCKKYNTEVCFKFNGRQCTITPTTNILELESDFWNITK